MGSGNERLARERTEEAESIGNYTLTRVLDTSVTFGQLSFSHVSFPNISRVLQTSGPLYSASNFLSGQSCVVILLVRV